MGDDMTYCIDSIGCTGNAMTCPSCCAPDIPPGSLGVRWSNKTPAEVQTLNSFFPLGDTADVMAFNRREPLPPNPQAMRMYFPGANVMSLTQHPKPRVRVVTRHVNYPQPTSWQAWLCVGCGTYVYGDTAEEAYKAWHAKRALRWIDHQRDALRKDLTTQYGKPC